MGNVKCGIDRLEIDNKPIRGLRLGLITNYTGVNSDLNSTIDILNDIGDLRAMFSPEHGVRGDVQAGVQVQDYTDERTGVKVYSLYGDKRKPTEEMLRDIDAFVFDIQDVGARFYTYLYTMSYAMEAAKEFNKKFILLDRPNPIGGTRVEGIVLNPDFSSFVGMYPIPTRYGMTIGELARLFNEEFNIDCDLEVVGLEGWHRDMYFEDTGLDFIASSPNIPNMDTALIYTGTCLFEGTNVSEGRGTPIPFQVIGAPWLDGECLARDLNKLDLPGVRFRPHYFIPIFSKYEGKPCRGVQIHIRDRDNIGPFKIGVTIIDQIYSNYDEFEFLKPHSNEGRYFFDLLAGTDRLRKAIIHGKLDEYLRDFDRETEEFMAIREKYIIY